MARVPLGLVGPVVTRPIRLYYTDIAFSSISRDATSTFNYDKQTQLSSTTWHSDVTYEKQPPGLTALVLFDSPPSGGDTGYADQR